MKALIVLALILGALAASVPAIAVEDGCTTIFVNGRHVYWCCFGGVCTVRG